jgi:hypothetical protein
MPAASTHVPASGSQTSEAQSASLPQARHVRLVASHVGADSGQVDESMQPTHVWSGAQIAVGALQSLSEPHPASASTESASIVGGAPHR